jgi:hypothetical protein
LVLAAWPAEAALLLLLPVCHCWLCCCWQQCAPAGPPACWLLVLMMTRVLPGAARRVLPGAARRVPAAPLLAALTVLLVLQPWLLLQRS